MPFCAWHSAVNCARVRVSVVVDVTLGLGDTPPSHAVSGTGVSPLGEEALELEAEDVLASGVDSEVVPLAPELDVELVGLGPDVDAVEVDAADVDAVVLVPEVDTAVDRAVKELEPAAAFDASPELEARSVAPVDVRPAPSPTQAVVARQRRPWSAAASNASLAPALFSFDLVTGEAYHDQAALQRRYPTRTG